MAVRKMVKIDEEKCNGCGLCVPACAERALAIIDGKARLISETHCDGLGACLGECPRGAITIEEREAAEFDEETVKAHLQKEPVAAEKVHSHACQSADHTGPMAACPSARVLTFNRPRTNLQKPPSGPDGPAVWCSEEAPPTSELTNWPIQLTLVPPDAPYFANAHLLLAADCAAFTYADFHREFLKDKALLIGCPKLDDPEFYRDKLTQVLQRSSIKRLTVVHMEVPCCYGLVQLAKEAIAASGKDIPFEDITIGINGEKINI